MAGFDLHGWFDDHELQACPRCRERKAVTTPTGAVICIECGLVGFDTRTTGETSPTDADATG